MGISIRSRLPHGTAALPTSTFRFDLTRHSPASRMVEDHVH
jgi:hypothetical protein